MAKIASVKQAARAVAVSVRVQALLGKAASVHALLALEHETLCIPELCMLDKVIFMIHY